MRHLPSESVDLVVSDPPYLISYKTNHRKDKSHKFCHKISGDSSPKLIADYMKECYRVLKNDSAAYIFCSSREDSLTQFIFDSVDAGFKIKNIIVWVKNNWSAGDLRAAFGRQYEFILLLNKGRALRRGKRYSDVWSFDRVCGKNQLHQNQKPIDLIKRCIECHSDKGDIVLDGFMGSGTTAVASILENRNFIGWELDNDYFKVAEDRVKNVYRTTSA